MASRRSTSRRTQILVGFTAVAFALAACGGGSSKPSASSSSGGAKPKITVGAANFAENTLLANIYALALQHAGYQTSVKQLTTREVIIPAIEHGDLQLEPDYAATLLTFLKGNASGDVTQTVTNLRAKLPSTLHALQPAPAVDTNGFVVTKATAQKYNLSKMSDLAPVAPKFVLGGAPECPQRPYCLPGLEKTYGLHFKSFKPLDTGGPITVAAVKTGKVDVGELFTTDPSITANNFVLLQDDKHLQNADNIIPIVNASVDSPQLDSVLNQVNAKITTDVLTQLVAAVSLQHHTPQEVAAGFLSAVGLG